MTLKKTILENDWSICLCAEWSTRTGASSTISLSRDWKDVPRYRAWRRGDIYAAVWSYKEHAVLLWWTHPTSRRNTPTERKNADSNRWDGLEGYRVICKSFRWLTVGSLKQASLDFTRVPTTQPKVPLSLLEFKPKTGYKHQLRVHAARNLRCMFTSSREFV